MHACVRVRACVRARVRACVRVCVCVREGGGERELELENFILQGLERERERERENPVLSSGCICVWQN